MMKLNKKQLCALQCRLGLTGVQVAEKAGIKPQCYSTVKNRGTCAPATVGKIAAALGVDVTDIIEEEE